MEAELIGKNVSGLGFDVKGNPRDGISISNIHDRGAARENSLINVGKFVSTVICSTVNAERRNVCFMYHIIGVHIN